MDDRGFQGPVQSRHRFAVIPGEGADHHAIRMREVVHGRSFREELRVRDVADVGQPACVECAPDLFACANRDGALHDEDHPMVDLRDLVEHRVDRGEVSVARVRGGRSDADEHDAGGAKDVADVEGEAQAVPVSLQ